LENLINITDIEKAFYQMSCKDEKLQEYFFSYYHQKLVLLNHLYPHIESQLRGYTDHGPQHITRILNLYTKILKDNIPGLSQELIIKDSSLNFYELYLLLCGTVWHDVGNILGRKKHNEKITEIADRLKDNFFVDDDMKKYTFQIAEAHTGKDGVREKIKDDDIDYKNEEINMRFLGVLLRLIDELEEGELRVDKTYYKTMEDQIPVDQKIYWETSLCIKRIDTDPINGLISINVQIDENDLFKIFTKNGRKIALIDEIVFRIDKMNEEREYYMKFVRKHIEFRKIQLEIKLKNTHPKKITFEFNNNQGYKSFWEIYPKMNPKNIEGYILQKEKNI